jgi:hypothetical protein
VEPPLVCTSAMLLNKGANHDLKLDSPLILGYLLIVCCRLAS